MAFRVDPDARALESAQPHSARGSTGVQRHKSGHRRTGARDHDILAGCHSIQQRRKLGLGLVDIDLHRTHSSRNLVKSQRF